MVMFFNVTVNYVYYVQAKKNDGKYNLIEIYKETHKKKNGDFVSQYAENKLVSE
jgi:hypothetical protein